MRRQDCGTVNSFAVWEGESIDARAARRSVSRCNGDAVRLGRILVGVKLYDGDIDEEMC